MEEYRVSVKESSRDLTARERIRYKNSAGAIKLDEAISDSDFDGNGKVIIAPVAYVVLDIHNDKSDPPDYNNYVIIDKDDNTYVTGSSSFWKQFKSIWDEMSGENEAWEIEVFKVDSKNYKGKKFITCNIL